MPFRSLHSSGLTSLLRAQKLLVCCPQTRTHPYPTSMHLAIDIFKRIGAQLFVRKLNTNFSFSPSYKSCHLNNFFYTSSPTITVQMHFKRSLRHFTSRTSPSRAPFSERPAVHTLSLHPPGPIQPFSLFFRPRTAFWRIRRLFFHEVLAPRCQPYALLSDFSSPIFQLLFAQRDAKLATGDSLHIQK